MSELNRLEESMYEYSIASSGVFKQESEVKKHMNSLNKHVVKSVQKTRFVHSKDLTDGNQDAHEEVMRASETLENLQLDRKTQNLTSSWSNIDDEFKHLFCDIATPPPPPSDFLEVEKELQKIEYCTNLRQIAKKEANLTSTPLPYLFQSFNTNSSRNSTS
ncbi:hypothetical protein YC2023_008175 [Brassica napus]